MSAGQLVNQYPLSRRSFSALAAACAFPQIGRAQPGRKLLCIGSALDNSGIGRVNGIDLIAGSRALVERVNREGGIHGMQMKLLAEDDRFDPAVTRQKTELFVADPSVIALLHPLGTQQTAAMMLAGADLPIVGPSTGTLGLHQSKDRNVFWTRASYADEMDGLLATASTLSLRSAGLVYPNDQLGQSLLTAFQAACAKHKLQPVATATTPSTLSVDVEPAARAIAQVQPQLVILGLAGSAPAFVKAFRGMNRASRIFGLSLGASVGGIRAMGEHARGMGFSIVVPSPTAQKFELIRRYQMDLQANGSTDYSLSGVEGYLAASVLVQGLRRAGPAPSRQTLHAALEGLTSFDFGGVRIGYGKGNRQGNQFVTVAVVSADGRLTM